MVDRWIVFGGWAVSPKILAPLFGQGAVLIDTNEMMPLLVRENSLVANWQEALADHIAPQIPHKPFGIAGWSTGALLAYALAPITGPACGVFISATPSFCRKSGFLHGWRPSVLNAMREELASDPGKVMAELKVMCGIADDKWLSSVPSEIEQRRLIAGLFFLEQTTLLPINKIPFPSLFLHGKSDAVIPPAAGKYFCAGAKGTFVEYEGPHAFFVNQYTAIANLIRNHFT
jgi:pimeloyl-ACP methyl ester carboxylesterase